MAVDFNSLPSKWRLIPESLPEEIVPSVYAVSFFSMSFKNLFS